jgi:hypothetical protein
VSSPTVPFFRPDLSGGEIREVVAAREPDWPTTGPRVRPLEELTSEAGLQHAIVLSSCTSVFHLAVEELDLSRTRSRCEMRSLTSPFNHVFDYYPGEQPFSPIERVDASGVRCGRPVIRGDSRTSCTPRLNVEGWPGASSLSVRPTESRRSLGK